MCKQLSLVCLMIFPNMLIVTSRNNKTDLRMSNQFQMFVFMINTVNLVSGIISKLWDTVKGLGVQQWLSIPSDDQNLGVFLI